MKKRSIKSTILSTVTVSLLGLALLIVMVQTYFETQRAYQSKHELISEQIELVLAKLDIYRIENQKTYVAKTLFNLNQVSSVKLFDKGCTTLTQRPFNFNFEWDCKSELPRNFVVYSSKSSFADTPGAVKFVLAKLNKSKLNLFSKYAIYTMVITFLFILLTLFLLNTLFTKKVMSPLKKLKDLVATKGIIKIPNVIALPEELIPIFNNVVKRDEVIRLKNIELNKMNNQVIKTVMRKEFAHNIKFPLTLIRDFILEKKSVEDNQEIYLNALKDLETLSSKIGKDALETVKVIELNSFVSDLVESKLAEFANDDFEIEISIESTDKPAKIKFLPVELRSILSNIVNNSKEATIIGNKSKIQITIKGNSENAIIEVKDNGQGIDPNNIDKLFNKGASFNKPAGSGLGLYHAKKHIEKFGGSIKIQSHNNSGSLVTIKFPKVSVDFYSNGSFPFKNVLVEDYKLCQLRWYDEAVKENKSLIIFSSPKEFEENINLISKEADIYIDSNFPDTKLTGEDWSQKLFNLGFKNLFMCTTKNINLEKYPWIRGAAQKNKPFKVGPAKIGRNSHIEAN